MRVYIAGKMRSVPFFNFPAFDSKRDELKKQGYDVVSPADIDRENGFDPTYLPADHDWNTIPPGAGTKDEIMRRDVAALMTCHAIYLLHGWEDSVGARAEASLARWAGMYIMYQYGTKSPTATEISEPIQREQMQREVFDKPEPAMRTFASGATRNTDTSKLDFEGFLSPLALEAFAEYMHSHRQQTDGVFRDSDNWQKGIPFDAYMKSMWRHFMDFWKLHRGLPAISPEDGHPIDKTEALCSILFNVQGYLHEHLKEEANGTSTNL